MYNVHVHLKCRAVLRSLSKTCAASFDLFEIGNLPLDLGIADIYRFRSHIGLLHCMQSMRLILSFASQNCALFLVLRGLFTFSSSMHPFRVSGITKPISWLININNMGKNFRISNVVAFEYPTNLGEEFTYLESCNI